MLMGLELVYMNQVSKVELTKWKKLGADFAAVAAHTVFPWDCPGHASILFQCWLQHLAQHFLFVWRQWSKLDKVMLERINLLYLL